MAERPHGRPRYVFDKCRCDICSEANRQYGREYADVQVALGRWTRMRRSAAPVRQHVADLASEGVGYKKVARAAGVSTHTMAYIVMGRTLTVMPETAAKILAVRLEDALGEESMVSIDPTLRHVEELVALGYSKNWIARALGYAGTGLQYRRPTIRKRNADAIANLRARIGDLPYEALHNMTTRDESLLSLQLADMIEETRRRVERETVKTASPDGWVEWRSRYLAGR